MKLPTTLTSVAFSSRPIEIVRLVIVSITVRDLIKRSRMIEAEGAPHIDAIIGHLGEFDGCI